MFSSFLEILSNTPWWVFPLFLYLLYVGFRSSRPRTVSVKKLAFLPVLFLVWSLYSLLEEFPESASKALLWVVALFIGAFFGWKMVAPLKIQANRKKGLLYLPGTWWILFLILLNFGAKFYFSYNYAIDPQLKSHSSFFLPQLLCSGTTTGILLGRFFGLLHKFRQTKT